MMEIQSVATFIDAAHRKGRAAHMVVTTQTRRQTFGKGGLTTTEIAGKYNDFPTLKFCSEALADAEGIFGTGSVY